MVPTPYSRIPSATASPPPSKWKPELKSSNTRPSILPIPAPTNWSTPSPWAARSPRSISPTRPLQTSLRVGQPILAAAAFQAADLARTHHARAHDFVVAAAPDYLLRG